MPFAGEEGSIAGRLQNFGDSDLFQRHFVGIVDVEESRIVGAIVAHAG